MGEVEFANLEDYYAKAYVDSSGNSIAYTDAIKKLLSTNIQISALNSTINSQIKQNLVNLQKLYDTAYYAASTNISNVRKAYTTAMLGITPQSAVKFLALRNISYVSW